MIVKIIAGLILAFIVLAMYSCLVVAGRADDEMERQYREKQGGENG